MPNSVREPKWKNGKKFEMYRFFKKIRKTKTCWIWTGSKVGRFWKKNLYEQGVFYVAPKKILAHRFSYMRFVGKIPAGYTIDHLCNVPTCVNPTHLEPKTMRDNAMRGNGISARNSRKTHCVNGHELAGDNLEKYALKRNHRKCKVCRQNREKNKTKSPKETRL